MRCDGDERAESDDAEGNRYIEERGRRQQLLGDDDGGDDSHPRDADEPEGDQDQHQAGARPDAVTAELESGVGGSEALAVSVAVGTLGVLSGAAILLAAVVWRTGLSLVPSRVNS